MKMRILILIGLLLTVSVAAAQDNPLEADADPRFVAMRLEAGFQPDPTLMSVRAGGPVDASTVGTDCVGYVNAEPDVTLNWTGTDAEQLRMFFFSDHDPTLIVRTPDGSYHCNDDASRRIVDPEIDIDNPVQGRYAIWVGSFEANQTFPGFLVFTSDPMMRTSTLELRNLVRRQITTEHGNLDVPTLADLNAQGAPVSGDAGVGPGDLPATYDVNAGGSIPAFAIDELRMGCNGFITAEPTFTFDWSGQADMLRLFVDAPADTTLMVRTPDERYHCNDDTQGGSNLNPLVDIESPGSGTYAVYIGTFNPEETIAGTLTITDSTDMQPAALRAD